MRHYQDTCFLIMLLSEGWIIKPSVFFSHSQLALCKMNEHNQNCNT